MRNIEVQLNEENITIKNEENIENVQIKLLEYNKEYTSKIKATSEEEKNKILLINKKGENVILVYTTNKEIKYIYTNQSEAYKKIIKLKFKVINIKISKKYIKLKIFAYIENKYNVKIDECKFWIDDKLYEKCNLCQYNKKISKKDMLKQKNYYKFKFNMQEILKDESTINGAIKFSINIDGNEIDYKIGKKDKNIKNTQYYYSPIKSAYIGNFAIHIRRTPHGNLVLVKRLKEQIEKDLKFRILESKFISIIFYTINKILKKIRKKKINLFYEKFASKAEEGTFDLFLLCGKKLNSKNYFIIDEKSKDYDKIKESRNIIKKYSLKYYWLIYNANNCISTEAPIHLNILRSNNKYLRKSLADKKFIFLQHGITYLKCHDKNSPFNKGKEGQADYIIVGSEKEKKVIMDMLEMEDNQILKTGLPIFSKIQYNHINNNSENNITIMITWKPYEEQLYDFEKSSYYKNIVEIYNMLCSYMIDNKKIIIIAHPRAQKLLEKTDLKQCLWNEPISKALEKTKLLITDYSSVCYNVFYQGAGVIFYQPDLEIYEKENGKLIPKDDEYIGKRAFNINELENIIQENVQNSKINLEKLRIRKFEENYKTINEFSDGKNIERIYQKLEELKLI